jgi:hypothetical protein
MLSLDWQVVAEIATTVSTVAFAASAIVVVLRSVRRRANVTFR